MLSWSCRSLGINLRVAPRCSMVTSKRPASNISSATSCATARFPLERISSFGVFVQLTCVCGANHHTFQALPILAVLVVLGVEHDALEFVLSGISSCLSRHNTKRCRNLRGPVVQASRVSVQILRLWRELRAWSGALPTFPVA